MFYERLISLRALSLDLEASPSSQSLLSRIEIAMLRIYYSPLDRVAATVISCIHSDILIDGSVVTCTGKPLSGLEATSAHVILVKIWEIPTLPIDLDKIHIITHLL